MHRWHLPLQVFALWAMPFQRKSSVVLTRAGRKSLIRLQSAAYFSLAQLLTLVGPDSRELEVESTSTHVGRSLVSF
jgi:hypothetical protein